MSEGGMRTAALQLLEGKKWAACIHLLETAHAAVARHGNTAADGTSEASPAKQEPGKDQAWMNSREAVQMLVIARIHHHASRGEWQHIFRLPNQSQAASAVQNTSAPRLGASAAAPSPPATAEALRSSYRRTAALIHPDKCSLPHAAEAFKLLAKGFQLMQGSGGKLGGGPDEAQRAGEGDPAAYESWAADGGEQEEEEGYR
jgi:hypothetical protein